MMNRLASTSKSKTLGLEQHEIHIPVPSYGNTRQLKADRSLIEGTGKDYLKFGAPLYRASITCDWKAAQLILDKKPELVRYSITDNGETALHVAASARGSKRKEMFVKNLVQRMESTDLEIVNNNSNTALCLAAASANLKTVQILLENIPRGEQIMPLCTAVLFGNYDVVCYLYEKSNYLRDDGWNSQSRGWLLEKCVEADMFDVALKIVKSYPQLGSGSVLGILARKPEAFYERKLNIFEKSINSVFGLIGSKAGANEKESTAMQLLKIIWEDIAKKPREEIYAILTGSLISLDEQRSFQILFIAAEMGNTKFLVELVRQYPDLMLKTNDKNQTIIHIAIEYRHESIYKLLYEIGAMKNLIIALKDDNGDNMLHLVAKSTKKQQLVNPSGVALQMHRDLLWFKEVQHMIPFIYRERRNKDGLTPHELFAMEHKELVKEGERWTKDTINFCVVVSALIATVTFAATITIPGGFNQNNGIPIFYQKPTFVLFIVVDAISLFLSSTSILVFLSISTSRFAEIDFLGSLPKKLCLGISSLFLSVATMMVAFCLSFFILYHNEMQWMPIFVSFFGSMSISLYIVPQYHLFTDLIRVAYGSTYFFKPRKQSLF